MPQKSSSKAGETFHFFTRVHLRELTGLRAHNLTELLEHLRTVPGSVIYHHTHHFLQQHQYLSPEPPNDFAYWVTESLNNNRLGERLASINTTEFPTIRDLREKIIKTIESEAERKKDQNQAPEGEEFHFVRAVSFVLPTPYVATDLQEFLEGLKKVTIGSLYYHIFESRLRLEKPTNDFSHWLEENLGEKALAGQINKLDPYTHTMEGLRKRLISLIEKRIPKMQKESHEAKRL